MKHRGFVKKYISFILFVFFTVITFNYVIDPFGVFKSNILKNYYQYNERFIKIDYLIKNKDKYNSYMFGSSRIGNTDPSIIEKYIKNSKFYNFTVAAANIYDYKIILEWMLKNNFKINNIYMQIDLDNYYLYGHNDNLLVKHHYLVDDTSLFKFYFDYLTKISFQTLKEKIRFNLNPDERVYDIYNTGMWKHPDKEEKLKNSPEQYVLNEISFHKNYEDKYKIDSNYNKIIFDLKTFVKLCENNNINLILFTTPHNHNMMDTFEKESVLRFVSDISEIMDFWYFSGYNFITNDDTNYYETSHYKEEIGVKVVNSIFNKNNKESFGIYVSKNNRLEVLKYIGENIDSYRKK